MSSKKWLVTFFATLALLGGGVLAFNFLTDPFGVFPGALWEWPSYEMTLNPRSAKVSYIQEHHQEYDSYIIGCSSTSSYPTEQLNEYFDASFYNMFMYGADMLDVEQIATYLIENYTVKNLVVGVYIDNAITYDTLPDERSFAIQPAVTGEDPVDFYSRFLFMDPRHGLDKLEAMGENTYAAQAFDVFDPDTGAYDKKERDAEFIGGLEDYLAAYPAFAAYPEGYRIMDEGAVAGTLESLARMRDLCGERGINLLVVCAPVYHEYMAYFDWAQVEDFYTRLAQVTPYWDFSLSSVSFDPRYFYDETHFRNCVGEMALARIFGDGGVYVPEDFGAYVTADNVSQHLEEMAAARPMEEGAYTAVVPVLMYHDVAEEGDPSVTVSPERLEEHLAALKGAGYTAVTLEELSAYVEEGAPLPEKPVVITFDDGYLSNYQYAWPLLQKYGMPATIFAIGINVGQTERYKDTVHPITPRFSYEQGAEMVASGLVSVQSHTYDMHQWAAFEEGQARENILRWEGEPEEAYREVLARDCQTLREEFTAGFGEEKVNALAFPSGQWDQLAQVVLLENGFDITFTTQPGDNTLVRGMSQSLLGLDRYTVGEDTTGEALLALVANARG